MPTKKSSSLPAKPPAHARVRRGSEADAQRMRTELLAAALAQFIEGGLENVTMRAVATRVGVSAMTPYRYFEDKGHLLRGIWQYVLADMVAQVRRSAGHVEDPRHRIRVQLNAFIDYWEAHPQHYRLVYMTEQTLRRDEQGEFTSLPTYAGLLEASMEASRRLALKVGGDPAHARLASDMRFMMVSGYLHGRLVNRRYPWSPVDVLRPAFIEVILDAMENVLRNGPQAAPSGVAAAAPAPAPASTPAPAPAKKRARAAT